MTDDEIIKCPLCDWEYTHFDSIGIAARPEGEDAPAVDITIDSGGYAQVNPGPASKLPAGLMGEGRRHRIVLMGTCEQGCRFALVFTQHKGNTFYDIVDLEAS